MNRFRMLVAFSIAVTLGTCAVAEANVISPYVWFWPGATFIAFPFTLPASLLAAFVERPFLTCGGLKSSALALSLRANFLSTIVGVLLVPIGYPALFVIGPFWSLIALILSCVVETWYLRRWCPGLAWGWVAGGNFASSFLLVLLPPIAVNLELTHRRFVYSLQPYELWLGVGLSLVSLVMFLGSFMPRFAKKTVSTVDAAVCSVAAGAVAGPLPDSAADHPNPAAPVESAL